MIAETLRYLGEAELALDAIRAANLPAVVTLVVDRDAKTRDGTPLPEAAKRLAGAGAVDTTVIALWLGHESVATTQIYIHADLALKERAIARTAPLGTTPGRYQPPDAIMAFLEAL